MTTIESLKAWCMEHKTDEHIALAIYAVAEHDEKVMERIWSTPTYKEMWKIRSIAQFDGSWGCTTLGAM